jgi:hypothetical protein
VVINTIYDPSDGDNELGRRELGLSRLATIELRRRLNAVNRGIAKLARERGFLLADLERLFHGHGITSNQPWFVQVIEPNLAGASAVAEHWYQLLTSQRAPSRVYLKGASLTPQPFGARHTNSTINRQEFLMEISRIHSLRSLL